MALYTSLSTNYAIDFPENDSVALPLGDLSRTIRRASSETRNLRTNYGRSEGVTLEPVTVYSNSTEMIHAEQIVSLSGGLRLGSRQADGSGLPAIKNETGLDLQATMVLHRDDAGAIQMAWIGELATGASMELEYRPVEIDALWVRWQEDPITQSEVPSDESLESSETDALWIGGVLEELVRKTPLMPGQTRLFAYSNDRVSKLNLAPAEDQFDGRCLIVAHLTPPKLGDVQPDRNIRSRKSSLQIDASNKEALDQELEPFRKEALGEIDGTLDDNGI